ncbi:MAG TPA: beta-galactosidase [Candidatus Binataceae bacterium]|nr:beta-galactosidase [Candidatus Binataceae bacterium]
MANPGKPVPSSILMNPSVDGVALLFLWQNIEPGEGDFQWRAIDEQVERIHQSGKVYSLGVIPGINTPAWVYRAGAAPFQFRWDKPWGPPPCSEARFPIPWDPVYLSRWKAFVRALGERYARDPRLVLVKIQGVNAQTPEFLLPHDRPGEAGAGRLVQCEPTDEVAEWQRVGYRPAKVREAWKESAEAYRIAFPRQQLAIESGPWGMPPIDASGTVRIGHAADRELPSSIIRVGKELLDGQFVAQNDGLEATWSWQALPELAHPGPIAFQMAWKVTDDPACRMNHFTRPCDPGLMLEAAIDRGIEAGASYLEIYQADLLNRSLNQIIAKAHRRLHESN